MVVSVARVPEKDLLFTSSEKTSSTLRQRVEDARAMQRERQGKSNAELASKNISALTELSKPATDLLNQAADTLQLSARGYFKLIKVARTIADLESSKTIKATHMAEALQYRQR